QVVPVVVGGKEIPLRWDGGPCRGAGPGDVRPEREEVSEQARDDRRMQSYVGRPERPCRRLRPESSGLCQNTEGTLPCRSFQSRARIDERGGVARNLRIRRGEVHDPLPVVPGSDDGPESRTRACG